MGWLPKKNTNAAGRLLLAVLVIKATLWAGVLTALTLWGPPLPPAPGGIIRWPQQGEAVFLSHFATWDAAHYLLLAELGYAKGAASCAFYPLLPMILRASWKLSGANPAIVGLVLCNLCSLAAWTLFHRLVARRWGETAAWWALLFLIVYPGSLFFQFIYTESLFLLLLMGVWWGLETGRSGRAAVCAGLLPLCRGVGAFAVLPLAWHALRTARPRGMERRQPRLRPPATAALSMPDGAEKGPGTGSSRPRSGLAENLAFRHWRPWVVAGMPVLGWCVYLGLMWHWTGNPFEGFEAQKRWGVHSVANLWDVPKFLTGFLSAREWHAFKGSFLDRCVFVLFLYTLPVLWRLDKGLWTWALVLGVLPAMSGTFTSFIRFASCAFPMFVALGVVLSRPTRRWWGAGLLAVFLVLHAVLVWQYVNFRWAG